MSLSSAWWQYHINHAAVYSLFSPTSSRPPRRTPWTSVLTAYTSFNGYCGPTETVLPPSVRHRPAVQHVQPTTDRIPVEFAGEKTPYFGAPSNAPAGGYANTAPGVAYNCAGAGATTPVAFTLTPAPQGDPKIAQPGPLYAATHARAPIMAAHFPTAPVAPAPAPPGATCAPSLLGATYAPPPLGTTYAPSPLGAAYAPPPLGPTYAPSPLGATYAPSSGASAHTIYIPHQRRVLVW